MKTEDLGVRYQTPVSYRKQVSKTLKDRIAEGWFLPLYSKQVEGDAMQVNFNRPLPPWSEVKH
jgi:hypothetical protein